MSSVNYWVGGDNVKLLMGTISDLWLLLSREVMERDAKDYADSIHAIFVETSAKNAININELFIEISEYLCALWVFSLPSACMQNYRAGRTPAAHRAVWSLPCVRGMSGRRGRREERRLGLRLCRNCWGAAAWTAALKSVVTEQTARGASRSWEPPTSPSVSL